MAENVGGIVWTAEMKTEQLVGAEKTITNTLNKTDQAFTKTGKASDQLNTRYTKTAQGVQKATKGMSRQFGMAGVQVQQFVGQIQGGQSALLALSQQGADLGIVMGAAGLGAAVGIGATALSFLLAALGTSETAIKDLTEATEKLDSAFDDAASGSDTLSKEIERLAKKSEGLAKLRISEGLVDAESAMTAAANGIQIMIGDIDTELTQLGMNMKTIGFDDLVDEINDLNPSMDGLLNGLERTSPRMISLEENIKSISERFKISRSSAIEFAMSLGEAQKSADPASIARLSNALQLVNDETGGTNKEFTNIQKTLTPFITAMGDSVDKSNALRLALQELNNFLPETAGNSKKVKDASDGITESLARQIIALDLGEKAAMEYATAQALQLKAGEKIPADIQAQIDKLFELKQAQKDLTALENSKKKAQSFATGVVGKGMSEEDRLTAEMDKLDQLYQDGLLDYQLYQDAKVAIAEQAADQLEAIGDKETKAVINNQKAMAGAVLGFISSSTSAIMSGMDDQSGAYKAMFALQQAASIASTILAAQSASVAALAPPPIGLGPIAGAGLSSTILGLGYASAGIQAGLAIGGGRINGGPVYPGMMHPVTEDGRPELLIQGGKQYLLPGSRGGEVISNKDMNKSGGQPNVNVNIMVAAPGMTADVQTKSSSKDIDVDATISAVADNIMNGGKIYSAMQKTTKSKSRTG